jgi:hypothetical protein
MEDAAFTRERMEAAGKRLVGRLREVRRAEEDRRRQVAYDEVRAERDKLAIELATNYPRLVADLAELLSRVSANANRIDHINERRLPTGAEQLLQAELKARGLNGFAKKGVDTPSLVHGTLLPSFIFDQFAPYTWPRPQHVPKTLARARNAEPASA